MYYIGCKQVQAEPKERDGKPGYEVRYPDGYVSWSPQETFEAAYIPMGEGADGSKVHQGMVESFIKEYRIVNWGGSAAVKATLVSGYTIIEDSSHTDVADPDEIVGTTYARKKIELGVWSMLEFLLAFARNGVTNGRN
jgi:hypothetical protein